MQRFDQEPLAHSLSPFVELLQNRSFVPANRRFVPPGAVLHGEFGVRLFGKREPAGGDGAGGLRADRSLGSPALPPPAESEVIFYFEPLRDEDLHTATAIALRGGARRWAVDFMPHLAWLADNAVIEAELLEQLSALIRESIRRSGGQPSLAFVQGQVVHLHYERSFDALARHAGRLILGRELLDLEAGD